MTESPLARPIAREDRLDAPSIELELRQALARNDRRRAASLMVEHYAPDVLACCRAMLRDRTLAEDLAQDTFGRAIAGLATYRGESSPRTWLLSIARNGCLDFLRRRQASPIDEGDAEVDTYATPAPAVLDQLVGRQDVERALAPLGETERALVVLHYGHGVGYPELAEAFSLREGAVRMRMSRAVEKMRAALGPTDLMEDELSTAMPMGPAQSLGAPAITAPKRARGWWPFGKKSEPVVPSVPERAAASPSVPERAGREPTGPSADERAKRAIPQAPARAPAPLAPRAPAGAPVPAAARAAIAPTAAAPIAPSPLRELLPASLRARLDALVAAL